MMGSREAMLAQGCGAAGERIEPRATEAPARAAKQVLEPSARGQRAQLDRIRRRSRPQRGRLPRRAFSPEALRRSPQHVLQAPIQITAGPRAPLELSAE